MRQNFRLKGYVLHQYLWTVRRRNGRTTTLLLEVFTQRNYFVADFISIEIKFYSKKQKNSIFEPPFRGLRGNLRTPSIAHWKGRGRLPIRHK